MNEFRSTILSRFDCIFLIRDVRNEKRDKEIARHVITMHLNAASGHEEHVNTDETIDLQQLKRYIQYCRLRVFPRLTEAASELLTNHYVSVRKAYRQRERNGEGNAIPITVRQLEAIVRISESLAKMTLSPFVRHFPPPKNIIWAVLLT
jgi:DNA replication licensing factor MCM5